MTSRARRVLLTFLNTGGGHRSAAFAVAEALTSLYGDRAHVELVDVTLDYFSWPLSRLNAIYRQLVRLHGWPWAFTYHLTDDPRRITLLMRGWWLLTARSILKLLDEHPADVIVCCHPLLKAPLVQAIKTRRLKTPLITLVTDLVTCHASWFILGGDRCLVATEQAKQDALTHGVPAASLEVTGLPIRPCFLAAATQDRVEARRQLDLDPSERVILLLSGAEGMGPFCRLLEAIVNTGIQAQIVAIAGRNKRLQTKLISRRWSTPVRVKGFVDDMHHWMRAADLVVTKAGPTTISEALTVGVPLVLSGAVPGQEEPNVDYVVEHGAAVWAPSPEQVSRKVIDLLSPDSQTRKKMCQQARELARPRAAYRVARILWQSNKRVRISQ